MQRLLKCFLVSPAPSASSPAVAPTLPPAPTQAVDAHSDDPVIRNRQPIPESSIPSLIVKGRTKIIMKKYPLNDGNRRFKACFFDNYDWVEWSQHANRLFCFT